MDLNLGSEYHNHVNWECLDSEDEPEDESSDSEDYGPAVEDFESGDNESHPNISGLGNEIVPASIQKNAFELIDGSNSNKRRKPYERGPECTERHKRRKQQEARETAAIARRTSQNIVAMFAKKPPTPAIIPKEPEEEKLEWAIKGMEKKLRDDRNLSNENVKRHDAVLSFMRLLLKRNPGETRMGLAETVSRSKNMRGMFARSIPQWERLWVEERYVPESKRGHHAKTKSWLSDEDVQLELRKQVSILKEGQSSSIA